LENGAPANKSHARQNAQRQAHQIEHDERIRGSPLGRQQQAGLNYGDAGRQTHQQRSAEPSRTAMLTAIQTNQRCSNQRKSEPERDFTPSQS
jgi:hypothetical protein